MIYQSMIYQSGTEENGTPKFDAWLDIIYWSYLKWLYIYISNSIPTRIGYKARFNPQFSGNNLYPVSIGSIPILII